MFLKKYHSEVWEARYKRQQSNKQPATDSGERTGKKSGR